MTPSSRLLGQGNHSSSDSSLGDFYGGDYTEAVRGYAYRSVELDRLHTLAKYTRFYNMVATDQVTLRNTPSQFIPKGPHRGIGCRVCINNTSRSAGSAPALASEPRPRPTALLRQPRAPGYPARRPSLPLEHKGRSAEGGMLGLTDMNERNSGAMFTIYRYRNANLTVGIGYNFSAFADDLTDLSYDRGRVNWSGRRKPS
jgi:hypothetical protein